MTKRKIALVTGASRLAGIGAATALKLAELGYDIFFTVWRPYDQQMPWHSEESEPDQLQRKIQAFGVRCEWLELDFMMEEAPVLLFEQVVEGLGIPDVLINNATYSTQTSIETITASELDSHYKVNVKTPTMLTKLFLNHYSGEGTGRIINMTSGQGKGPMLDELAYAMTKSSIEMMTTTLASLAAQKGVTINAINPGPTQTGWIDGSLEKELINRFPFGRVGKPEDTANLIAFLVSPEAKWVTGQIIHSEGGFMH